MLSAELNLKKFLNFLLNYAIRTLTALMPFLPFSRSNVTVSFSRT